MSSIYDELYRRRVSRRQPTVAEGRRHDLVADRLCMVDGIATTAAGILQLSDGLPEVSVASSCPLLVDEQGFPRLANAIRTIALNGRHKSFDGRLVAIWNDLAGHLEALVHQLPDNEKVDLVLTLSESVSPELQHTVQQLIVEQLIAHQLWQEGQSCCCVGTSQTINTQLAPDTASGAMRWVFWCSMDTLLDERQFHHWNKLSPKNSPIIAGEGGALILFERLPLEGVPSRGRFWVHSQVEQHALSRSLMDKPRVEALKKLMNAMVLPAKQPEASSSAEPPTWCIMDMGAGERAGNALAALFDCWPGVYELMANCYVLDQFCGWNGQAAQGVMMMMAAASMAENDSAMLLSLNEVDASVMTLLTPVGVDAQV